MSVSKRIPIKELNLRPTSETPLIWGQKISAEARQKVRRIGLYILTDPDWLMACMAFESGRTFSPATKNLAGSGAVGLIQIMPDTVRLTPEIFRYCEGKLPEGHRDLSFDEQVNQAMLTIALMTVEEYLDHIVLPYFKPYRGRLNTLEDCYMAILYPRAIGKPDDYILFINDINRERDAYDLNKGLDGNKDWRITKREAAAPVRREYEVGKKYEAL